MGERNMAEIRRRKLTRLEKAMAKNLNASAAAFTTSSGGGKVNYDKLLSLKAKFKEEGKRISMTAFFVKAVADALKESPDMNTRLGGEEFDEIIYYDDVNVGVGIDTPKGLIVAVIKRAQDKTLFEIADDLNDKVDRARVNRLTMDDITDSTVTISNMYNSNTTFFTSNINNFETLHVGFGGIYKEPVVGENDEIKVANIGQLIINMNHTTATGWPVGVATDYIVTALENPEEYLI